jgi:GNAT superfamily N-acetyltransferase
MTSNNTSRRADENLFATFSLIARSVASGEVRESGGLLVVASGLPLAMFNLAFVTRRLDDPARQMEEAIAYFDGRGLPFLVRIREGLDPAAETAAKQLGLVPTAPLPGMVLEHVTVPEPFPGLTIRTVVGEAMAEEYLSVLAAGFGAPLELFEAAFKLLLVQGYPDLEGYTGYYEGKAVCTSLLFLSNRTAGVYNVATVDEARKRGLGEAMTWHAIRRGAAMGAIMSNLQASAMGMPIYERMGYRLNTNYQTFERP